MISLLYKSLQLVPNTRLLFLIFPIYAVLLVKEVEFFSLFLPLEEIRRVMSAIISIFLTKNSQKFNLDSIKGIDYHRERHMTQKSHNFESQFC